MIERIISDGRPGVGRGALDAAATLDIPCNSGRKNAGETGPPPPPKQPWTSGGLSRHTAACIARHTKSAHGTLSLALDQEVCEEIHHARNIANKCHLPWHHVCLGQADKFQAAQDVHEWLVTNNIRILHVIGATAPLPDERAASATRDLLETIYYLGLIEHNMTASAQTTGPPSTPSHPAPRSTEQIISQICAEMSLKDRVHMANMQQDELATLSTSLGRYIMARIETWRDAPEALAALELLQKSLPPETDIVTGIITKLWHRLQSTHKLRVV